MLGLVRAAAQWAEPYLSYAQSACAYWTRSRPSCSRSLPANHLSDPSGLSDASASVIASLAMLSLADLAPDGIHWRTYAHQQITAIIRSKYFTGFQKNDNHEKNGNKTASGIFWGCCYKTAHEKEELVESAWGSFFLMAALCILIDAVKSGDF
jgi:unsaturated chondroitin disaccharide hydrolase